mmetsp:Transcript_24679/g.68672  ORF Transcript_24679/g.68672 Transcript_24679/m.68672 type:complete len:247 (-) Transcript_24679:1196-1936(-)
MAPVSALLGAKPLVLAGQRTEACSRVSNRLRASEIRSAADHAAAATSQPRRPLHSRRRSSQLCRVASDRVSGSVNDDGTLTLPNVELMNQENGAFSVNGDIEVLATPEEVYKVLADFNGAPRIFSNIVATERLDAGPGKIHLLQKCRWKFLMFSGTFNAVLSVREVPEQKVLLFELVSSSFMREFEGRWKVVKNEMGNAVVEHSLTVKPTMLPPPGMGGYTRKIFVEQEMQVLEDLKAELIRRQSR